MHLSKRTIRRRLNVADLISKSPAHGPELIRQHRANRLSFARTHIYWNLGQMSPDFAYEFQMIVTEFEREL